MVGNAPPRLDELQASVRSMEVIRWYVDNKDAVLQLEDIIRRHEESAEKAGVGKDLNASRETAKKLVADAEARARSIDADASRLRAQAEEILAHAKATKAETVARLQEIEDAKETQRRSAEEQNAQLLRRKVELDTRERKIVMGENANKQEADRLAALRQRLEAALKGP